jgi:phosphoglycerate dehydrogenase-like enzyme
VPTITLYLPPHHNVVDAEFEGRFPNYVFQKTASVAELAQALPATDVLLTSNPWYLPDVAKAVREHGKKLKWIQFSSVGIDTALANGLPSGVPVTNVRGVRTGIIAGHAITLMMGLMRGFHVFEGYRQNHVWAKDELSHVVLTAEGKTLVIVGMGDIGRDCARKAKAFDMKVIGVSREGQAGGNFDEVVPRSQLHAILPKADVLLLALPLEDETRHIIGAREIALMKPSAMIVNIARGALIDEAALITALQEKKIAGAAMDVVEVEPLPADSPLWSLENVLFSPHIAGHSDAASKHALAEMIADNMRRFAAGEPLRNIMRTEAAGVQ